MSIPTTDQAPPRCRITSLEALGLVLLAALLAQGPLTALLDAPALRTGATVFVAVCVQAMPFLVFGVLVSGAIAAFVPASAFHRVLPRRPAAAVPVAGLAGVALPGCECASVPVSRRLMQQGVPQAAALAFLLAAPAVNPVVLASTAVAFPDEPRMVLARFAGSLATALVMGWLWVDWAASSGSPSGHCGAASTGRAAAAGRCSPRVPGTTWSPPAASWCWAGSPPPRWAC